MGNLKHFVTLTLAIIVGFGFLGLCNALEYNEECSDTSDPCNPKNHLICKNVGPDNYTVCACNEDMYYDFGTNLCVVEAEKECLELVSHGWPHKCTNHSVCVQPAVDEEGVCQCDPGTIPKAGQCKVGFGGSCAVHADCHTSSFLTCTDDRCTCDQELTQWDPIASVCKSLVGGRCDEPVANPRQCIDSSLKCISNICQCNDGLIEAPNGQCLKGHDQPCANTSECHPNFECIDLSPEPGKCGCPNGSVYQGDACVILAGHPCNPVEQHCVQHATCSNTTSVCECVTGYSPSLDGHCKGDFGTTCHATEDCNESFNLECTANLCDCRGNYTHQDRRCVGNVGAGCNVNDDCITNSCPEAEPKVCECFDGSVKEEGTCFLKYGQNCGGQWQCYTSSMACLTDQMCGCANDNLTHQVTTPDKCVGKADTPCDQVDIACVANASCRIEGATNMCRCDNGFGKNEEGHCEAGMGGGAYAVVSSGATIVAVFVFSLILKS